MADQNKHVFRNSPQRFAKTRDKAQEMVRHMERLVQRGTRTLVGIVVDTSFHVTRGYVLCQIESGVVPVYGVPYGQVVPQMRLFVQSTQGLSTNRSYVFLRFAPALSTSGNSGSLLVGNAFPATLTTSSAKVTGVPTDVGSSNALGYYWHCYFYLPQLPTTTGTLFQFVQQTPASGPALTLTLDVLPTGILRFLSSDGHGFITTQPIAPHQPHWVVIVPGQTNQALLVDSLVSYAGALSGSDVPSFVGGGTINGIYTLSMCSNLDGSQLLPLGSWVSKLGYGLTNSNQTAVLSSSVPDEDALIPHDAGAHYLYLCMDDPTGTLMTNTIGGTVGAITVSSPLQISALGPY